MDSVIAWSDVGIARFAQHPPQTKAMQHQLLRLHKLKAMGLFSMGRWPEAMIGFQRMNELAVKKSLEWFERQVIAPVPARYAGGGRRVYPGFVQLTAFMSMNLERHQAAHRKMYAHLAAGETEEAEKIKTFYDEYFAVLDLTEEFYLETIDRVFQRAELAKGAFTYRGEKIDCGAIRRTALLTVEGGRDDICGLGQTSIAHDLCKSLRPHLKRHHLQANVGHYGVFNGKRWLPGDEVTREGVLRVEGIELSRSPQTWDAELHRGLFALLPGQRCQARMQLRADRPRWVTINTRSNEQTTRPARRVELTPEWQAVEEDFTAQQPERGLFVTVGLGHDGEQPVETIRFLHGEGHGESVRVRMSSGGTR